ncbi:serine hydrolase domain-containing protein [Dinghuibacter silviterrae]|uniref:CubicO group peptidase (Beta-lactamase class C family) n=1 Tax=Dinghuibacter silviterrae TaxID=1539049 RepID=A0A4R8DNY7_9BACT|nr:serine hydrolase domain-containing protein [Dinghuibacter silviterrae]TDW99763.1 CubicO group peptidase (beta-lactamase class C family) [Dinghuibacter silviterrae]
MLTTTRSFILGLCLLAPSLIFAQKLVIAPSTYNFKPLDQVLEANQKNLDKNFTVLVDKNNQLVYGREMGEAKANLPVPVGSISKWLTAALTLALVDQGKLSLDDKVSTYLPIFKTYGKAYITVRQCLTHFTGLAGAGIGSFHLGKYSTLEAEVNDLCAKREIGTNPGTEFRYTDAGYAIAGRVLEVITKKSFAQLVKETLFRPLNMQRSSFPFGVSAVDPADGALCSPLELLNFATMILNKGVFNGKRVLSEASVAELLKAETTAAQIKSSPIGVDGYTYAMGAWIQSTDASGQPLICAPSLKGSWAFVDFGRGYAAVVLVNKEFSEPKKQVYVAIEGAIEQALQ